MNRNSCCLPASLFLCAAFHLPQAHGDTFGNGVNSFDIDFVTIGNPGNAGDADFLANPVGAGSVPYAFRIGTYEISEQMVDKANALGSLGITKDTRGQDYPATSITWYEAAKFVNWLNTSTGNASAYKFDGGGNFQLWQPADPGYDPNNRYRNHLAKYFIPNIDEWYKAAFYEPTSGQYLDYPTGSNSPPMAVASGTAPGTAVYLQNISAGPTLISQAGGLSPYGTMGQGGNVQEWQETAIAPANNDPSAYRVIRGGAWASDSINLAASVAGAVLPTHESTGGGFRVAGIVPEPATSVLLLVALFVFLSIMRAL